VHEVVGRWTIEEFFAGTRPPTDDEVPMALDCTPLDTPAKLIAYLEQINAERERFEHLAG
jgi:hypothetical protein